MPQAFIHAGFNKTGTTSVQHTFAANRATLLERGFLYPGFARNHAALYTCFGEDPVGHAQRRRRPVTSLTEVEAIRRSVLGAIEAEVRAHPEANLLISSEAIAKIGKAGLVELRRFIGQLGYARADAVVYVRDYVSMFESTLQQLVKKGRHINIEVRSRSPGAVRAYRPGIEALAEAFGADCVQVGVCAAEHLTDGDVVADLARRIGLDLSGIPLQRVNESLPGQAVLHLNEVNRDGAGASDWRERERMTTALRQTPGEKFTVDRSVAEGILQASAADRAYLAATWFGGRDVLGELAVRTALERRPASA